MTQGNSVLVCEVPEAHLLTVGEVLCYGSVKQLGDVLFLCHICQGVLQDMLLQHRLSLACIEHPARARSHFLLFCALTSLCWPGASTQSKYRVFSHL